jgi:hypothetical protein
MARHRLSRDQVIWSFGPDLQPEIEIEPGNRAGQWQLIGQLIPAGIARIAPIIPRAPVMTKAQAHVGLSRRAAKAARGATMTSHKVARPLLLRAAVGSWLIGTPSSLCW